MSVVALVLEVGVEGQLVAHRHQPRAGHHHRLGAALQLVHHAGAEVLDDDLGLLGDVGRVQVDEAGQGRGGLVLVELRVVGDGLGELEEALVGGVALEHIEDEALLDGLAHGVEVEGRGLAVGALVAEQLQGLVLGRGREGEEAHVGLRPAEQGGAQGELVRGGEVLALFRELRGDGAVGEQLLDGDGHLAGLGGVGLVDDDGVAPVRQMLDLVLDEAELVDGGDDDGHPGGQGGGELGGVGVDLLHHPGLVLELVDGVLQLLVEDLAVGQHHHGVVDLAVLLVV